MRRLRPRALRRPALLGLPAVAAAVLALGACHHDGAVDSPSSAPATPTSSPSTSGGVPQGPAPTAPSPLSTVAGSAGSDGLTVRYLGHDGTVKTVGVEDFPR